MSLPVGWVETTLGEIVDIYSGKTRPKEEGIIPVYGGNGILNYTNKYNQEDTTIIVGRVGAYCGNVFYEQNNFWLSDNALGIKNKDNSNMEFLYYKLVNMKLNNYAIGGAQPLLTQTLLKELQINIPIDIQEQKAIANILSSFDEKIELLKEQNKTLERMAQAVFKEWFVDFNFPDATGKPGEMPHGWKVGKLGEEFNITMGQSPKGETYNKLQNGIVFYQGRAEFQARFPKRRLYTTAPKRYAEKFDVLMSVRAPVGDINVASEKCCIGRGLSSINSKYKSYAFYKMKSLKKEFDSFEAEGTVFGSINKSSLENLEVIIPEEKIIKLYDLLVYPMDSKIYNNSNQIQTLQKTRDTLLPKLMSGEKRVQGFKNG